MGAEGWNASKNFVSIKDATLCRTKHKTEAMGVIGGRGFLVTASIQAMPTKGSLAYGTESAIANNNVVVISNSHLGLDSSYKWSSDNMSNNADATAWCKYSVFGGYPQVLLKDNIVVVENSIINGNVYGGFELQNQLTGQNGLRELHSNVVSLHNVKIMPGNAVYGTATADTVISTNSDLNYGADGQVFLQ